MSWYCEQRGGQYDAILCSVFCVLLPRLAMSGVPLPLGSANPRVENKIESKVDWSMYVRQKPTPPSVSYCTCSVPTYVSIKCPGKSEWSKLGPYLDTLDDGITTEASPNGYGFFCIAHSTEGFFQDYYVVPAKCSEGGGLMCQIACENHFSEQNQTLLSNALTNCVGYFAKACGPSAMVKYEYGGGGGGAMWYVGSWCANHPPLSSVTVTDAWEAKEIAQTAGCVPSKDIYCCPFEGVGYTKADGTKFYWTQVSVGADLSKEPTSTGKTCPTGNPETICVQWKVSGSGK